MLKIITTRRICQVFFLVLFLWFCVVTTLGEALWQLRGWPVNWLLQLDPLAGLATLLSTGTLYAGLLWGVATVVLTILLGRFFCGWVCPFGTIHQAVGYVACRKKPVAEKLRMNRYRTGQSVKYWILTFLLFSAMLEWLTELAVLPRRWPWLFGISVSALAAVAALGGPRKFLPGLRKPLLQVLTAMALWAAASLVFRDDSLPHASLQIGLLDPIPLLHRSVNLILLPLLDGTRLALTGASRHYPGSGLIAAVFTAALLLNLAVPRFYCRFVCPLGALFGILSRYALWRIGKSKGTCTDCFRCERNCEGACAPMTRIRLSECVLCLNCLDDCHHGRMTYGTAPSAGGEIVSPDLTRRAFLVSAVSGVAAVSMVRIGGSTGPNFNPLRIRPPGSLTESDFLTRCIKCGQCMRVCPTNVIHPAGMESGVEGFWTPVLNFRIGTSGCQFNCIACGNLCPTAAIRPISLDERLGRKGFAESGPIRIGTAFIDRGRCLPWAMDIPCIVCQENCPVSPKAIFTREQYNPVRTLTPLIVRAADNSGIELEGAVLIPDRFSTGDYFVGYPQQPPRRIVANTRGRLKVAAEAPLDPPPMPGSRLNIAVRLQQPFVDPSRCIGCGVCEHECPVKGKRAIRVTAENESRAREHRLLIDT